MSLKISLYTLVVIKVYFICNRKDIYELSRIKIEPKQIEVLKKTNLIVSSILNEN